MIFQLQGYPKHHYFVKHNDWNEIRDWLWQNDVDYLQEYSGPHGIGFTLRKNVEWFMLRWA